MFAARSEMITQHFTNADEDFILCDRYYHASIAYQGYGRGLSLELIKNLIEGINCRTPDLTIIYDLDVKAGFKRKANDVIDRIESSGIDFFEQVRKGYQQLSIEKKEVEIIDASQSIEIISQQTKDLINQLF
jgi:dTMP kinase